MKKKIFHFIVLITSILYFSCSSSNQFSNIYFHDSYKTSYELKTAPHILQKEYNLENPPKLILLATSKNELELFKLQLNEIYQIDAEEINYIYIIANAEKEYKGQYYTSMNTAKRILSGKMFKIIIFNEQGKIIKNSDQVLYKEKLKKILRNK